MSIFFFFSFTNWPSSVNANISKQFFATCFQIRQLPESVIVETTEYPFNRLAHHLCINKVEFRPDDNKTILASCGNDGLVRVYEIEI